MKKLIFTFLLISSLTGFSQKITEIKVEKSKLKDVTLVYDLIKGLPGDCKIELMYVRINSKSIAIGGPSFSSDVKVKLNKLEKGESFIIQGIQSTCPTSHKKEYKITVE